MAFRQTVSAEDWLELQVAPYWVFMTVSAIDRKVDQDEIDVLLELYASTSHPGALTREVLSSAMEDLDSVLASPAGSADLDDALPALRRALANVPDDEAAMYRAMLGDFAERVAAASGRIGGSSQTGQVKGIVVSELRRLFVEPGPLERG